MGIFYNSPITESAKKNDFDVESDIILENGYWDNKDVKTKVSHECGSAIIDSASKLCSIIRSISSKYINDEKISNNTKLAYFNRLDDGIEYCIKDIDDFRRRLIYVRSTTILETRDFPCELVRNIKWIVQDMCKAINDNDKVKQIEEIDTNLKKSIVSNKQKFSGSPLTNSFNTELLADRFNRLGIKFEDLRDFISDKIADVEGRRWDM